MSVLNRKIFYVWIALFLAAGFSQAEEVPAYSCERLLKVGACANVYHDAKEKIIACAESGDLQSQIALSDFYIMGGGDFKRNPELSFKWALAAAEQDCAEAQKLVGYRYYNGEGTIPSLSKAIKWWTSAAELGEPEAMCALGVVHLGQQIADYSYSRGFELVSGAYEIEGLCGLELAHAYYYGLGTEKDLVLAKEIIDDEATKGNPRADAFSKDYFGNAE